MMASKPSYIDVRSKVHGSDANYSTPPRGFLSPRTHVAGEVPPTLSPLDAFAAQSRLLAQQLEEKSHGENRLSRLPPFAVANSLSRDQSGYFTSVSQIPSNENHLPPSSPSSSRQKTKIEAPINRHMSIHPTVCGPLDENENEIKIPPIPYVPQFEEQKLRNIRPISPEDSGECFSAQVQQQTPPSPQSSPPCLKKKNEFYDTHGSSNLELISQNSGRSSREIYGSISFDQNTLAPKMTNFSQRSPSPYSLCTESSDDDYNVSSRRLTPSDSQFSENVQTSNSISSNKELGRSSSISSDASFTAIRSSNKPSRLNFSRPLARSNITHELHSSQVSPDSNQSLSLPIDETQNTPLSTPSETFSETASKQNSPVPSYVYAKYALPRGKTLKRNSMIFQSQPPTQVTVDSPHQHESAPSSPLNQQLTTFTKPKASSIQIPSPSFETPRPSTSSSTSSRPSLDPYLLHSEKGNSSKEDISRPKSSTETQSTQKAKSSHLLASSSDLSATEHVEKAIEYHQAGALNKSTYHLRLAARMSHPTGMLLYALACRHGWGMRPNQREGVAWLRRAADEAGLEVADDENLMQAGKVVDLTQMKSKKAQFALSIYELGVSHMNGWGIEQDKALGLRCFEIAGSWGDADAMAEAGFCYAQGVGCKKDLKKSARFYRMAEAKGINMIGNSWIYKAKYNEDPKDEEFFNGDSQNKPNSVKVPPKTSDIYNKSRGRGIFRRSKVA